MAAEFWDTEHPDEEARRALAVAQRVEAKLVEHEAKIEFGRALAELEPAPPFDLGTLGEVLARPQREQYRVDGLILADGFTSIVAARKTGKTTFNLNLVDALLTGHDFLDRFPVIPVDGTVAILNYEVSGHQLGLWADRVGVDHKRLILVNLRGRRNPLAHEQDRAELSAKLRALSVESLFIDPFSRAFYGESQQDNTQVQAFLNDLDVFARTEVGVRDVVLTVHAGWNGDRSRGASALEDHPDSIVWLRKDSEAGDNGPRFMSALGRDVDVEEDQLQFDPYSQRLSLTGLGSRQQVKREQRSADLEPGILELVAKQPGVNTAGVTEALRAQGFPFRKGDEIRTLNALLEAGQVERAKGMKNASLWYPAGGAPIQSPRSLPAPVSPVSPQSPRTNFRVFPESPQSPRSLPAISPPVSPRPYMGRGGGDTPGKGDAGALQPPSTPPAVTARGSNDPGYCVGCGGSLPCTNEHSKIELERLAKAGRVA